MNKNTAITLNDRFSMLSEKAQAPRRGRSRSRSRGRQPQQQRQRNSGGRLQGSRQNRMLLDKLEKQHKLRAALNLRNKNLLRSAGRTQAQIIRNRARRTAAIKKTINPRNIRRANSLTTFVPLKDEPSRAASFRGRSRSRSRSRSRARSQSRNRNQPQQQQGSVLDRLGVRPGRFRMRRGPQPQQQQQQQQRSRSRSRVKLNRNNFNNQNQQQLRRNNSQARLGRQQSQQRNGNTNIGRRGNSRARQIGANQVRRRPRVVPSTQLNRPIGGRIMKKNAQRVGQATQAFGRKRGIVKNNVNRGANARNRAQNGQARGRARQRGQVANQQQQRRGRSRTRRGVAKGNGGGGGNRGNGNPQISKAQLDKQLDDYMNKGSA